MRTLWVLLILLVASCATPPQEAPTPTRDLPSSLPIPTATLIPIAPKQKPTEIPNSPPKRWLTLASTIRAKAQLAIDENHWEDTEFKKEAYKTCQQMIELSDGQIQRDSKQILKQLRWGLELMDESQLEEVMSLIDRYN